MDKINTALEPRKGRVFQFFHDLTLFTGLLSYAVIASLVAGLYQVNWQHVGSSYVTQINSVDVERLSKQMAEEGLASGKYGIRKDGSIYLKEGI